MVTGTLQHVAMNLVNYMRAHSHVFFFFFQAEDGIRDYKVTGVQTCALPILRPTAVSGHYGLGHGSGAHAPDEYFVIEPSNPKVSSWDGAVASHVAYLYEIGRASCRERV